MSHKVTIALGSNLDNPQENLALAAGRLAELACDEIKASSIWSTQPEGFDEAVPDFCNAVVQMSVELSAMELLAALQAIETGFGRERSLDGYQSRRLDLDIIDYAGEVIDKVGLTTPHPRAFERQFVLAPLEEIDPLFRFPSRAETLAALIELAPKNQMTRLTPLIPLA